MLLLHNGRGNFVVEVVHCYFTTCPRSLYGRCCIRLGISTNSTSTVLSRSKQVRPAPKPFSVPWTEPARVRKTNVQTERKNVRIGVTRTVFVLGDRNARSLVRTRTLSMAVAPYRIDAHRCRHQRFRMHYFDWCTRRTCARVHILYYIRITTYLYNERCCEGFSYIYIIYIFFIYLFFISLSYTYV